MLIKEKQMLNNSNSPGHKTLTSDKQAKGFTILELIIAMVVFLIVTGAAYSVMLVAQGGRTTVSQQVQLTKNVRLALNLIGRDTYNAGYNYPLKFSVNLPDNRISTLLALPNDMGSMPDTIPPVIAGNNTNPNTFAVPNTNTDQITFLFKDSTFNVIGDVGPPDKRTSTPLNVSGLSLSGGVSQATIDPSSGINTSCKVNDIFVITGGTGSSLGVVTSTPLAPNTDKVLFASGDVLNFNQNGATSPIASLIPSVSMQRITVVTYFVAADGTLMRRNYGNSADVTVLKPYVDNPLVYGVENFQIQYVLDNGTLSDNPSAGPDLMPGTDDDDQTRLNLVRQIRFTITVKSSELNKTGQPVRVTMTSTFGTRNLGYNVN